MHLTFFRQNISNGVIWDIHNLVLNELRPNISNPKFRYATSICIQYVFLGGIRPLAVSRFNTDLPKTIYIYSYDNVYNSITIEVSFHTKRLTCL